MITSNSPPISPEIFSTVFSDGLSRIISSDPTPGELVLVAGNGMFLKDPELHDKTERLCSQFTDSLDDLHVLSGDELILKSALEKGLIGGPKTVPERRVSAEWAIFLNAFRALRPAREAGKSITDINKPFDPASFNFHRVANEAFWHGVMGGIDSSIYYNKYPLAALHSLLVPDQDRNQPQLLDKKYHNYAWEVMSLASPGTVLGYNSLGAFASVNHLHFQLVVGNPTTKAGTLHGGNNQNHPIRNNEFDSPEESWQCIQSMHTDNQPYNLIYSPGRVTVFPRKFQGTYSQPAWTDGFAWFELAGNFVAKRETDFHSVSKLAISQAFEQMGIAA